MDIAEEVWSQSKPKRSYQENKEEWGKIFSKYRDGSEIRIPLKAVEHLIPNEYNYYSDGYLNFFSELGFDVIVPSPMAWVCYGIRMIFLIR